MKSVINVCCGQPCFAENYQDEYGTCWGDVQCIDCEVVEYEDGDINEYRTGSCEGHWDVYRDYDKLKYKRDE